MLINIPNTPPKALDKNVIIVVTRFNKGSKAVNIAPINVATCPKTGTKILANGSIAA